MNLGNALSALGEREPGTARLSEAVVAYRAALEELTRDRVPLYWAITTANQGNTMARLADKTSDLAMAKRALDQILEGVRELRDGGHAHGAEHFERQIPDAEALVARLRAP
jgi:hypothetical protein